MAAYVYQGPLAPWALPHFIATTGPSDSHPSIPVRLLIPGGTCRTRRLLEWVSQPSFAVLSARALSSHPDRPDRCVCPFFPVGTGFTISGRLATGVCLCNEADSSSPLAGLGLALSSSRGFRPSRLGCPDRHVSRASLPPHAVARLDGFRTLPIIDSFHSIRSAVRCWLNQRSTEVGNR